MYTTLWWTAFVNILKLNKCPYSNCPCTITCSVAQSVTGHLLWMPLTCDVPGHCRHEYRCQQVWFRDWNKMCTSLGSAKKTMPGQGVARLSVQQQHIKKYLRFLRETLTDREREGEGGQRQTDRHRQRKSGCRKDRQTDTDWQRKKGWEEERQTEKELLKEKTERERDIHWPKEKESLRERETKKETQKLV